ncbi:EAL domain-containing protein [Novosphingobium sp. BL-8H]|uniref:putative bifunctional diguanylate cyclase/phosphodiesterase n=1 Tax=Novosphingobium sp. BL-8H TaxID=3127640 RepID=UPI00375638C3
MLQARYSDLRAQIPLMYGLIFVDACFLALVSYGKVADILSLGVPAFLSVLIALRAALWISRRRKPASPSQIQRFVKGLIVTSVVLGLAFGSWGFVLMGEIEPGRVTAVALYVFLGAISCCYCLQALPIAGRLVLFCGALPVTVRLVVSGDPYLSGIGLTFLIAACVILRMLANSNAAFEEAIEARAEMTVLIEQLQASQEHYRHSVALNPQIPWIADGEGAIIEVSPRWSAYTGLNSLEALGWGWTEAVHPDDLPRVRELWSAALLLPDGADVDVRYRLRQSDGEYRWFRARALPRRDAQGDVQCWYGTLEDIHDQVLAEDALTLSEERYRLASLATNDIIWDVSLVNDLIVWSGGAATVLGYPEVVAGTSRKWWVERIHPDDRDRVLARFPQFEDAGVAHWVQDFRFLAADGAYLDLFGRGHVVRDGEGRPVRLIGSLQDMTSQKRYEDKLRWAANHDYLTGLPNRRLFADRLDRALGDAASNGTQVRLLVVDVDRFKATNDDLGHDAGDALLREISNRLVKYAPSSATVARLGGDEFAIILHERIEDENGRKFARTLLSRAGQTVFFRGRQLDISLSAGSAVGFRDGQTPEELHKSADLALYAAKNDGPGRFYSFRNDLREAAERETQMLHDAREALLEDRVVAFYQPKVCLCTGKCVGFEALLRWHHASGLRSPDAIGAALSDPDLSTSLTDRMLDQVISDLRHWRDTGVDVGRIAINGAEGDFRRGDFADRILGRLARVGLPAEALELEVTENVFVGQLAQNVSSALHTLSRAGVKIALDDFGTGYASLTHLKQFPVDTLKIDRSFISRLENFEREDAAIVGAVIDLARNLSISTVAEGIETAAQAAHLARKYCDHGQGFLFGRPTPASHIPAMLRNWNETSVLAGINGGNDGAARHRS